MSEQPLEQLLEMELAASALLVGDLQIVATDDGRFELSHRDPRGAGIMPVGQADASPTETCRLEACAPEMIAKFDDEGNYRPLRTAPNLRHGWKLSRASISEVVEVIDEIYPARLAAWRAWKLGYLTTTPLRKTLNRQSGMYRVAARIFDEQVDDVVGNFCRSNGGCLRTILWRRDETGALPSSKLPPQKFDPTFDQTGRGERCVPLLCQEACNLLVSASRDAVKSGKSRGDL